MAYDATSKRADTRNLSRPVFIIWALFWKTSRISFRHPGLPDLSDEELKEYDYLLGKRFTHWKKRLYGLTGGPPGVVRARGGLEGNGYAEKALSKLAVLRPALYKETSCRKDSLSSPPAEPYAKEDSKEFFSLLNAANLYHERKEMSGAPPALQKAETIVRRPVS